MKKLGRRAEATKKVHGGKQKNRREKRKEPGTNIVAPWIFLTLYNEEKKEMRAGSHR